MSITVKFSTDGKYLVLPSGELHIRDVGPEDGYKSYQCRTKHRLTGETRLSATKGRLVITGKLMLSLRAHSKNGNSFPFLNSHLFRVSNKIIFYLSIY